MMEEKNRTLPEEYEPDVHKPGRRSKLGAAISKETAARIMRAAPESPDPELLKQLREIRATDFETGPGGKPKKITAAVKSGRQVGLVCEWLFQNGGYIKAADDRTFYLYEGDHRIFELGTDFWHAWLHALTAINPAKPAFRELQAKIEATALMAPVSPIVRVAAWDGEVLRVSRFDGTVYVLDGESITTEANGENVFFIDRPHWQPYELEESEGWIDKLFEEQPNWASSSDGLAFRAWILATFFTELCPTRPLLLLVAKKGAGKTTLLRLVLRSEFGPDEEVMGVPDKADAFMAATAVNHLMVIDNLDKFTAWMQDRLARLATGSLDAVRRYYTTLEEMRVRYRTWLAITARTPDTLQRDDIADRLVILRMNIIEGDVLAERDMLEKADSNRSRFWYEMLQLLNAVVKSIREGNLKGTSQLRMADWASLGRVIAQLEGREAEWMGFIHKLQDEQQAFVLEGDIVFEGLQDWLQDGQNFDREVTARVLHGEIEAKLFSENGKNAPRDWPKSTKVFGKRLGALVGGLGRFWKVESYAPTSGEFKNINIYSFEPLEGGHQMPLPPEPVEEPIPF